MKKTTKVCSLSSARLINNWTRYMQGITIAFLFLTSSASKAQINSFLLNPDASLFESVSPTGWVSFRDNRLTNAADLFTRYKGSFGLGDAYSMKPMKSVKDAMGNQHIKFQQNYNDIPVYGAIFSIHKEDGFVRSGNGNIYTPSVIRSSITMTEDKALENTLTSINAASYYWQDPTRERRLREKKNNLQATYYPHAEKVYMPNKEGNEFHLTFAFHIYTSEESKSGQYFIDADNGTIVKFIPASHSCDPTDFESNWYGNLGLHTNDIAVTGHSYDLEDDCSASIYGVYDEHDNNDIFNTPNNIWASDWQRSAATSLWVIKQTYWSFINKFGLNGHDGDDGNLDLHQGHYFANGGNNNASYVYDPVGDDEVYIGIGNTNDVIDDYNALDILAHEFTHGVTQYSAGLEYEGESGALNESFSDIFGEWVEFDEFNAHDWFMGGDRIGPDGCPTPLRYFADPAGQTISTGSGCTRDFDQPNTYGGTFWFSQSGCSPNSGNDHCGVHTNSGVQNQMFYLLVEGGSGWNNGNTCHASAGPGYQWSVDGIGLSDAIEIAFYALYVYLGPTADYQQARDAWVHAAETLFGVCSNQAIQTGKAWYAVGFSPPNTPALTICNQNYGNNAFTISYPSAIVTGSGCYVNINNGGGLVTFEAGNYVKLNPGFHAVPGSRFIARLTDCEYAGY